MTYGTMDTQSAEAILLSILTSIITGGLVLVLVEIGNRRNRENDKYERIMEPFMRELSSYLRFISWCHGSIRYPKELNGYESKFKSLVSVLEGYGSRSIMSGDDYGADYFSANELDKLESDINNIWYYHDKMHPCRIYVEDSCNSEWLEHELKLLKTNCQAGSLSVDKIVKISEDHYCFVYKPIAAVPIIHEAYIRLFRIQSVVVTICAGFVLVSLCCMLFWIPSIAAIRTIGITSIWMMGVCLAILGLDNKKQIIFISGIMRFLKKSRQNFLKFCPKNFIENKLIH